MIADVCSMCNPEARNISHRCHLSAVVRAAGHGHRLPCPAVTLRFSLAAFPLRAAAQSANVMPDAVSEPLTTSWRPTLSEGLRFIRGIDHRELDGYEPSAVGGLLKLIRGGPWVDRLNKGHLQPGCGVCLPGDQRTCARRLARRSNWSWSLASVHTGRAEVISVAVLGTVVP